MDTENSQIQQILPLEVVDMDTGVTSMVDILIEDADQLAEQRETESAASILAEINSAMDILPDLSTSSISRSSSDVLSGITDGSLSLTEFCIPEEMIVKQELSHLFQITPAQVSQPTKTSMATLMTSDEILLQKRQIVVEKEHKLQEKEQRQRLREEVKVQRKRLQEQKAAEIKQRQELTKDSVKTKKQRKLTLRANKVAKA